MRIFYQILVNSLIAGVTNNFVWFALTYWAYLQTRSVLVTSFTGGIYIVFTSLSSFWFGSIVDHHKKKYVMQVSSIVSLVIFTLGFILFTASPNSEFTKFQSLNLWILILLLMIGVIAGNLRNISVPTLVTILVPEKIRDKANGLVGTTVGISFAITSIASGLVLAYLGMYWVFVLAIIFTLIALIHISIIDIPEKRIVHNQETPKQLDIKGTISAIQSVPGLFALIFFTTFNNFLGGVFNALIDAYGLTMVSVQFWGMLWGILSFGFIIGGLFIARFGLGKNPVKTLFIINIILWIIAIFFAIQPMIILLAIGMFLWLCLIPFIEAIEQTIIQKVVPLERQGRVFGFAQSIEQAASPITSFLIGPIAQFIFIPFMTTGTGVDLIGSWFGVGVGRGIALVFIITGIIGLIVTLFAMRSKSYQLLSSKYQS